MKRTSKIGILALVALTYFGCTPDKAGGGRFSPSKKQTQTEGDNMGSGAPDAPPPVINNPPVINQNLKGSTIASPPATNTDLSVLFNGIKKIWDGISLTRNKKWKIDDVE